MNRDPGRLILEFLHTLGTEFTVWCTIVFVMWVFSLSFIGSGVFLPPLMLFVLTMINAAVIIYKLIRLRACLVS